ncbi:MAG: HD domain-containing protein [Peptococcaceae bacterium]|jgi:HD-GYP domain-containing protein (c-di-GMP phosphodiesterase class II)|nr:HD domain-containing protein [Peptococcaceae bacterium]
MEGANTSLEFRQGPPGAVKPEMEIDLGGFLTSISTCLDFTIHGLKTHHRQVAMVALTIGGAIDMSMVDLRELHNAAIIHDAGAVTLRERAEIEELQLKDPWRHCATGREMIAGAEILKPLGDIVFCHHDRWEGGNPSGYRRRDIPLASRIIHLADRLSVLITDEENVINQRERILTTLRGLAGSHFDPDLVSTLYDLARKESFWLDIVSPYAYLRDFKSNQPVTIATVDGLRQIGDVFACITDAKSRFTFRHSRGVSRNASFLAAKLGFNGHECSLMEVAGLLHDLGKISIPDYILEKPASLTATEFNIIKQHTYYTYHILNSVEGLFPLPEWAAYHHEKLNGDGYPFHLTGKGLSLGARIVAVADVFTALWEDRPYRKGLTWAEIAQILRGKARDGSLDAEVVEVLLATRVELEST